MFIVSGISDVFGGIIHGLCYICIHVHLYTAIEYVDWLLPISHMAWALYVGPMLAPWSLPSGTCITANLFSIGSRETNLSAISSRIPIVWYICNIVCKMPAILFKPQCALQNANLETWYPIMFYLNNTVTWLEANGHRTRFILHVKQLLKTERYHSLSMKDNFVIPLWIQALVTKDWCLNSIVDSRYISIKDIYHLRNTRIEFSLQLVIFLVS